MTSVLAIFVAVSLDLGTLPFSIDEACSPFHHALGVPIFSVDAGQAWAIPCERLGSDSDEAAAIFQSVLIGDDGSNSIVLRGIGTHRFEGLGGEWIPSKFWLAYLNKGPKRKQPFAIDDRGVLYVIWYKGTCDLQMDWTHESTIVQCK